jgi:hypothetical protein
MVAVGFLDIGRELGGELEGEVCSVVEEGEWARRGACLKWGG